MSNKTPKRESFMKIQTILADGGYGELAEVMAHEIELVDRKNASKSKAQIEKAKETAMYADAVEVVLADSSEPILVSEVIKAMPSDMTPDNGWSTQKMTSILTSLVKAGKATKTSEKGRSYYALA